MVSDFFINSPTSEDVEKFLGINDKNSCLLMDRKMVLNRWRNYFDEISTVEFAHPAIPSAPPIYCPIQQITVVETEAASKKMKLSKATSSDDFAADLFKSKFCYPAEWLTTFFNQVIEEKKVLDIWQRSTTIPIWKKGSPSNCTNYRPIQLLSHSMRIFEWIVDGRICDIVQLSTNQCGFVAGYLEGQGLINNLKLFLPSHPLHGHIFHHYSHIYSSQ
ncbi:unnamed protein product [Heligmosomoides polygyrus]|uniref:Reverse transcriptase domain-containing protein n=1 Tax=Heligmosomoides polygyrus TaxID=6339 RepID=A0A183GFN2_HELPZ|nr:unnamed protein product [Heligmosomoides polygyrus]